VRFVAVTSCPTGIAHSEMAAEALEVAAREKGHEISVEVQGAAGGPPIPAATIAAADAVIFAVDANVKDRDRFAHLPDRGGPHAGRHRQGRRDRRPGRRRRRTGPGRVASGADGAPPRNPRATTTCSPASPAPARAAPRRSDAG
jgi:fructose PTS system EIIBC or EIIC component